MSDECLCQQPASKDMEEVCAAMCWSMQLDGKSEAGDCACNPGELFFKSPQTTNNDKVVFDSSSVSDVGATCVSLVDKCSEAERLNNDGDDHICRLTRQVGVFTTMKTLFLNI